MKPGSVIVDVAVDQGGCIETSKPTTHENPVYLVDGIIHYAVANMPGGVPRTSTLALTNATFPYAKRLARSGWKQACRDDGSLFQGLNVIEGSVVYPAVAESFGLASSKCRARIRPRPTPTSMQPCSAFTGPTASKRTMPDSPGTSSRSGPRSTTAPSGAESSSSKD